MKPLSQRDDRWKNERLGTSDVSIGGYGCVVTSLAMMFDTTPLAINDYLKSHGGYFKKNLTIWAKVPGFVFRSWQYNNAKVKEAIKKYGACMVQTDFDGNPRTNGDHYVVFIGNHKLLDPWTGTERPTSAYKLLKGYIVFDLEKGRRVFNPPDPCQEEIKNLEDRLRTSEETRRAIGKTVEEITKENQTLRKELKISQGVQEQTAASLSEITAQLADKTKELSNSQKEVKTANKTIAEKDEEIRKLERRITKKDNRIADLAKERTDYRGRYEDKLKTDVTTMPYWKMLLAIITREQGHIKHIISLLFKRPNGPRTG